MGWPLRAAAKYREFGGSFVYPMGDDMVTVGMVVGLDYRDAELSVHDLLQELKTHPLLRKLLDGGERVAWGAKTIPEGGFLVVAEAAARARPADLRRRRRARQRAGAEGDPLRGRVGAAGRRGCVRGAAARRDAGRRGALAATTTRCGRASSGAICSQVRNMRPAFGRGFWLGGALAGAMTATRGAFPPGDSRTERDADQEPIRTDRAKSYPAADGKLTFDKLSSVFLSGNATRDDAPNHIRVQRDVPQEIAELWTRMCPAAVYEVGERATARCRRGDAVELRPVRRDHRQGRPADSARGRRGAGLQARPDGRARGRRGGARGDRRAAAPDADVLLGHALASARARASRSRPSCSSAPARSSRAGC